jgi:CRP-like cAMP-binding protein
MRWKLLEGVPDEDVRQLLSVSRRRTFRKGEVVFHRGDPADSLHLISKVRFKVLVMTPLGYPATIAIRGPGDAFGEMAVVSTSAKRSATIEALAEAETFCVTQSEFGRLRSSHAGIDQLLIDFLANEVRMLNERLLEALYVPVEKRILRRLAELAEIYRDGEGEVVIPLTQEELAGLAGTTRATVNEVLRAQQGQGVLELGRGRTTITDAEGLAARTR